MLSWVLSRGQQPTSQRATGQTPKTHTHDRRTKTMTNAQIIEQAAQKAAKDGIISYTGKTFQGKNEKGEPVTIQEVEPVHTFAYWKSLGYSVKKGEKAKLTIMIWKHVEKERELSEDEKKTMNEATRMMLTDGNPDSDTVKQESMFMKKAFFFTFDQVEKTDPENEARIKAARAARKARKTA